MEWTNYLSLKFVNICEKFPILWDPTNKFHKVLVTKKNEAWVATPEELEIGVPELKKKMTSLLAAYRKVHQKLATPGKSGSAADDVDLSPDDVVCLETLNRKLKLVKESPDARYLRVIAILSEMGIDFRNVCQ
nr:unnamed protein product [Callosobruchus analis]